MSADETFGAPVTFLVDGAEVSFPRLYMDFYGTLEASVRSNRTAVAEAVAEAAALKGKERAEFVMNEVRPPLMVEDVDAYLLSDAGSKKTIEKSLETAGVEPARRKQIMSSLSAPDATFLARRIVGFLRPQPVGEETVEGRGAPKARDWDAEYELIVKHIPGVDFKKLTWHQYHLCLARAAAAESAANPKE